MQAARRSSDDRRIGVTVLAALCGVGAFVWWMMRLGRDPVAPPSTIADGQVVRFDPGRDRARPSIEWTQMSMEDCDNGAVPRVTMRILVPQGSSPAQWMGAAQAAIRAAVRSKHYCAVMVFVTVNPGRIIYGTPDAHASFCCAPGGQWERAAEAYPTPDYSAYAITYRALADGRLLGGG